MFDIDGERYTRAELFDALEIEWSQNGDGLAEVLVDLEIGESQTVDLGATGTVTVRRVS